MAREFSIAEPMEGYCGSMDECVNGRDLQPVLYVFKHDGTEVPRCADCAHEMGARMRVNTREES